MDWSSIADVLATRLSRVRIEAGGHEDGAAPGVEVEDLRCVGWEPEAVIGGPLADVSAAAPQDGDVERVDAGLQENFGAGR